MIDIYLFQALMALFVLASKDGWVSIMYTGLDSVGVNMQVYLRKKKYMLPETLYKAPMNTDTKFNRFHL